MKVGQW